MAEKLTLYGLPGSPYVQRVSLVLLECGVEEWECIPTSSINGETKHPDFLALNPFAKIPVLKDGDLTLFESRNIARYLLEKFPETGKELLGNNMRERAEVGQWVDAEAIYYNDAIAGVIRHTLISRGLGLPKDEAVLKASVEKLGAILDIYEERLAKHQFLALGRVSLADLTHVPQTALLEAAGYADLIKSRPNVAKWWDAISSRPSWVKIWDGPSIAKYVAAQEAKDKQAA